MRYVVKHPNLGYLSNHAIIGSANSIELDGSNTKHLHLRPVLEPEFQQDWRLACKYETEADAQQAMLLPDVAREGQTAGPFVKGTPFDGCTVETVSYFNG